MKEIFDPNDLKDGNKYLLTDGLLKNKARFERRNGSIYDTFPIFLFWNLETNSAIEVATDKAILMDELHSFHIKIYTIKEVS